MSAQRHAVVRIVVLAIAVAVFTSTLASVGLAAPDPPTGSFGQSTYTVTRGESVEIGFSHSEAASLFVGGDEVGYLLRVDVGGTGSSTVTIDTYASTSPNPSTYVSGGTPTLLDPATGGLSASLAPGEYRLEIVIDNVTRDVALLVIEPRPPADLTPMVAPGDLTLGDLDLGEMLAESTPRDTVARGDLAVFRFNVTGLASAVDPSNLAGGRAAEGITVHVEDRAPPPNRPENSFDATESPAVTTFWDEETAQLLVVWDTTDVELRSGGHPFTVSLSVDERYNDLVTENVTEATATIRVVRPTMHLGIPTDVVVQPWEPRELRVHGRTNLAPNTVVEVRIRGATPRPFLRTARGSVTTNGTFATTMDLSGLAAGPTYPLYVLGYRDATRRTVTIHGDDARFEFPNQTSETGETVRFRNVTLGAGGYLVVGSWVNDSTEVYGVSEFLQAGTTDTVTVNLSDPLTESDWVTARAYMDRDGNQTFEVANDTVYEHNGSAVERTAVVWIAPPENGTTVPPQRTTPTANATPTGSTETTIPVQESPPLTPVETTSTPLGLWVPVISLLIAAALARRGA